MIKAVLFDMGGVIHTVLPNQEKRLRFATDLTTLLSAQGLHISDTPEAFDAKLQAADSQRKKHNEQTGREYPPLESWVNFYLKDYGATKAQLFPIINEICIRWIRDRGIDQARAGLHECMEGLYTQGMRLGVISNTISRTFAPEALCRYGVSRYFEYVLLSCVCGLRKPSAEIFELAEQSMGLKKQELAYVGDTISRDVIGVRNAGWKLMIRLRHPEAKPEVIQRELDLEHLGYTPDYIIDSLTEVPGIIRAYNQNFTI